MRRVKSTSIMIKVEDEVYDGVIAPRKREKSFTKLVEILINGYYKSNIIRDFVTKEEDGIFEESYKEFDSALNEMRSSMSRLGFASSELESTVETGKDYFGEKSESAGKGYANEEFESLKKQVSEMMSQNAEILSLLKTMGSLGSNAVQAKDVPVIETSKPIEISKPVDEVKPVNDSEITTDYDEEDLFASMGLDFDSEDAMEEPTASASEVLTSIMDNVGEEF